MITLIGLAGLAAIVLLAALALLDAARWKRRRAAPPPTRTAAAMRARARDLGADRPTGMTYVGRRREE